MSKVGRIPVQMLLGGGDGNDVIVAGTDHAFLFGGNGDDTLTGGGESTEFALSGNDTGADVITNFHPHSIDASGDFISLSHFDVVHLVQSGADVLITDGVHTVATLQNVSLSALTLSDFIFF